MPASSTLTQWFLSSRLEPLSATISHTSLESVLSTILSEARLAWPKVKLSAERFMSYLAHKVSSTNDPINILQHLAVQDLYLACACIEGDANALATFEEQYRPVIDMALARLRLSSSQADEVRQILRRDLFVTQEQKPPLITSYAGKGHLRGWIQITAVRHALKLLRKDNKERSLDEQALQVLPSLTDDAEIQYMKRIYRDAFKESFKQALESLSPREINVLRHHFMDKLTTMQIGVIYRVHQTSAARWLMKAQETLLQRTKKALMAKLKLTPAEYDSIMDLVGSHLDITICTFFSKPRPE